LILERFVNCVFVGFTIHYAMLHRNLSERKGKRKKEREGFEGGGAVLGSKLGGASAATLGSVVYLYHVQLKPYSRPKKAKEE
jgi:hypothetical protein